MVDIDHQVCYDEVLEEMSTDLTPILPNLEGWTYMGDTNVRGIACQEWRIIDDEASEGSAKFGGKTNRDSFYVTRSGRPVRWEIRGYDDIFGSHFDYYVLDYYTYLPDYTMTGAFERPAVCEKPVQNDGSVFSRVEMALRSAHRSARPHTAAEGEFETFAAQYGKSYTAEELPKRREAFHRNLQMIKAHNADPAKSGFLAVNKYADMTAQELRAYFSGYKSSSLRFRATEARHTNVSADELPATVDHRISGAAGPVKDQCACGSCWAFGAVAAYEGRYFLKTGGEDYVRFSEQYVVDCLKTDASNGCQGGNSDDAYASLIAAGGIPLESAYPYVALDDYCRTGLEKAEYAIHDFAYTEKYSEESLMSALTEGPVAIAIAVPASLIFYSHGIYADPECGWEDEDLAHAVTLIGYGTTDAGEDYWLIRNSWSTAWGNSGLVYISREALGDGHMCGVTTDATYPIF
eukprot:gnl/Ergobibamus_cyprinoides/54.p1 GENE.gnl/Ergobibamus_cyprinoides/54~~gnl/Ergobibamus_cyprinoides/54.p1  ORF type:complete len:536 (-),score=272.60 gnl/Ergobibamus_cyprinoides/54:787-2175(-)